MQPRREILAFSPLAADALLLDAFYADEMRPLPVEWEPFLSTRQLALHRGLQGRWEEAVRLEPLPLLAAHYGEFLYAEGEYTAAIEVLREGGVRVFGPAAETLTEELLREIYRIPLTVADIPVPGGSVKGCVYDA